VQISRPLFLLALLAFCVSAACQKVALLSPTGSTITLTVSQTNIPITGSADVTAAVTESSGTAVHDGTVVTFTGGFGTFSQQEVKTVSGIARTTFVGNASGTAKIGAFSGAAKATEVEVKVGTASAGAVSVRAEPPTVSSTGGTVQVLALATDSSGNPLPGVMVVFSTDNGSLGSSSAITDSTGTARTTLNTNRVSIVTATVADKTGRVTVNIVTAPTVTITSNTANPVVGAPVAFTVTPSAAATANPLASVVVDFGDGATANLGPITGPTGVTHTYGREGGYTATATATDISGQRGLSSVAIVVGRQQLPTTTLSAPASTTVANPIAVTFTGTATAPAQIVSARVTLQDGTVIYSGTNANSFNYKFGGTGTYTLTGVVTDSNGNSAQASTTVQVNP
jgi:Bacterial Ig-like domain (group 1)/PKD domain